MLPRVLVDPPWRRKAAPSKPTPVSSTKIEYASKLVWEEGERESFRGKPPAKMTEAAEEKLFERLLDELDKRVPLRAVEIARLGDEKLEELAGELTASTTDVATMKLVLGRLGDTFVEQAIEIVRAAPRERGLFEAAMPIDSAQLARTAANAYFDRAIPSSAGEPYTRAPFESWMLRHPKAVVAGLAGDPSDQARAALAYCAAHGAEVPGDFDAFADLEPVSDSWGVVLATRGDARAISLLETNPHAKRWLARTREARAEKDLESVPEAVADLPKFFDPAKLARPRTKDGEAFPDDAVRALGEMLRFSPLANPYAGIEQVRAASDADSLDAFAMDLFDAWKKEEDPREVWAYESCGKIGGEKCARAVADKVRGWARGASPPRYAWSNEAHQMVLVDSGSREFSFARTGCNILAAIGGVGHTLLEDIARGGVQAWLRREAARALGRDEEGPHDDVEAPVPEVGLDPDGSATLDLGKRSFRVKIDEDLAPVLVDAEGERLKSFPRVRKDDDAKMHALAKERFSNITKDAKIVARYQLALVERMMVSERTFENAAFRQRFIEHTFLRHLGRRVVWRAGDKTFRIAEDGTFADANDAHVTIEGPIGVPHPVTMKDELERWSTIFGDYEIVQPFEQLGRKIYVRTTSEIGEKEITRILKAETTRGRLFQLVRRDWKSRYEENGTELSRELPCGALARFLVSPHWVQDLPEEQRFTIESASSSYALDRLPAIDFSELMRDLEGLRV